MQDALFLAHRIPYPPDKGDKIRSFNILRHLAQRWRIHLGCFIDDLDDRAYLDWLAPLCAQICAVPFHPEWRRFLALRGLLDGRPLTFPYFSSRRLAHWVEQVRAEHTPSLEFAFSSGVAPYLPRSGGSGRPLRVVDLVDLDSEKWRAYAASGKGLAARLHAREACRLAAAEVALSRSMDAVLLVSEAEAGDLCQRPGVELPNVHVLGNGVDTDFFDPAPSFPTPISDSGPALVFTGAMDYRANIDAVVWFADAVWPVLRAARPDLRWWIVGTKPDRQVQTLAARQGIVVTGRVADVRPWLAHATLAVAPLRIARGLQNKLLEALAMGRSVVATSSAATGLDPATRAILTLADEPIAMADAILQLLDDPGLRVARGTAGRRRMIEAYGWSARLSTLDRLLGVLADANAVPLGSAYP
jgi:sugar transferase (PEP-CTERM/EpsH1 system associated)